MKHLLAVAALGLLAPGCVAPHPPATAGQGYARIGFISEPGSGEAARPREAAAQLAALQATILDPPRHRRTRRATGSSSSRPARCDRSSGDSRR